MSRSGGWSRYAESLQSDLPWLTYFQAFVVTAGLCLALDAFHQSEKEIQYGEHIQWVERAIRVLEQWPTSSVAAHGIRLLTTMLQEHARKPEGIRQQGVSDQVTLFPPNLAVGSIAQAASEAPLEQAQPVETVSAAPAAPVEDMWGAPAFDFEMFGFDDLMGLPIQSGVDNNFFLESMASLQNTPYTMPHPLL